MDSDGASRREFLQATAGAGVGVPLSLASDWATSEQSTEAWPQLEQSTEAWPQLGYTAANASYAPNNTEIVGGVSEQWRFQAGYHEHIDPGSPGAPIVADGTVYVAGNGEDTERYFLYAIDAADGTERWRFELNRSSGGTPVVDDGTVYHYDGIDVIHQIDAAEGTEDGVIELSDESVGGMSVNDGRVYLVSGTELLALDGTGSGVRQQEAVQQWAFDTGAQIDYRFANWKPPAVGDGAVYIGNNDGVVSAVNADDGTERWTVSTGASIRASPAVADGSVYVGNENGVLYALAAADGTQRWEIGTGAPIRASPAVTDSTVFGENSSYVVFAIDVASGSAEWARDLQGSTSGTTDPLTVAGDTVYVNQHWALDDTVEPVYGLNAETGEERWTFDLGQKCESVIPVGGALYLGAEDGHVYAIAGETASPPQTATTAQPTTTDTETTVAPTRTATETTEAKSAPATASTPRTTTTADGGGEITDTDLLGFVVSLLGVGGLGAWWLLRGRQDADESDDTGDGSPAGAAAAGGDSDPATGSESAQPAETASSASTEPTEDASAASTQPSADASAESADPVENADPESGSGSGAPTEDAAGTAAGGATGEGDTKYCTECGTALPADGAFCTNCGAELPD